MRRSLRILLVLVFVCLCAGPPTRAAATSEAMGTVVDAQGNPVEGAVITFVNAADENSKYEAKTDKKGKYFAAGLLYTPPGEWKVSVRADGFVPSKIKVESKTQSALVARFEDAMRADGTPELVPIRPFGDARIDFTLIPADQAPAAGPRAPSAGGAASGGATDPIAKAAERVAQGDLQGSVEYFEKAIEGKPDDIEFRMEYARVLFKLEKLPEAEAQAKKAAELAPGAPGPNRLLASIYYATDRLDLADAAINKERQISPKDPAVLALVAQLADDMGHTDEAVEANEAIVAIDPKNSTAWLSLGDLYTRQGKADKSEEAFRKVTELDPSGAYQTFYNIGTVILNKPSPTPAETRKAVEAFRKAVEIKPDYAAAYKQLAYALLSAGELEQARSAMEKFVELEPDSADAKNFREVLKGLPKAKSASTKP
jgi:Flp pilus assembly protein TadD